MMHRSEILGGDRPGDDEFVGDRYDKFRQFSANGQPDSHDPDCRANDNLIPKPAHPVS